MLPSFAFKIHVLENGLYDGIRIMDPILLFFQKTQTSYETIKDAKNTTSV
jgi:hypothetical protein